MTAALKGRPPRRCKTDPDEALRLLSGAIALHRHGLNVIPVNRSKVPLGGWKQWQTVRQSEADVACLFEVPDVEGVAIVLGTPWNPLAVRDFDEAAAYERWRLANPVAADLLPTVATHRGFHVYGLTAGPAKSSAFDDGEFRAAGEYVVAPPSRHASGHVYRWVNPFMIDNLRQVDADRPADFALVDGPARTVTETTEDTEDTESITTPNQKNGLGISVLSVTITKAIKSTLPDERGNRNRLIFELCRRLKAIPECKDAEIVALRPIVKEWHQLALPNIKTKSFDATWNDFLNGWKQVKIPYGQDGLLEAALDRAKAMDTTPEEADRFDSDDNRLLFKFARELQLANGDGPFFMACPTTEKLTGIHRQQVHRFLNRLVMEGTIKLIKKGDEITATRYRFTAPPTAPERGAD